MKFSFIGFIGFEYLLCRSIIGGLKIEYTILYRVNVIYDDKGLKVSFLQLNLTYFKLGNLDMLMIIKFYSLRYKSVSV